MTNPTVQNVMHVTEAPRKSLDKRNGHEAILKGLITNKSLVLLKMSNGDSDVIGRVTQFDNFTITVMVQSFALGATPIDSHLETFFKHSIRSFCLSNVLTGSRV